jgi:hypothetical protein
VTFADSGQQQVAPAAAAAGTSSATSRVDPLQPAAPKEVFLGFTPEENAIVNKRLRKRMKHLDKVIKKLEADEIDVIEAQLLEPTGTCTMWNVGQDATKWRLLVYSQYSGQWTVQLVQWTVQSVQWIVQSAQWTVVFLGWPIVHKMCDCVAEEYSKKQIKAMIKNVESKALCE